MQRIETVPLILKEHILCKEMHQNQTFFSRGHFGASVV